MEREPATIREALRWAKEELMAGGMENPRLEAEVLLTKVLEIPRAALLARLQERLSPAEFAAFSHLVRQRALGYPLQYLTGHQEFMSLDFVVTPAVLIPRPDTEVLVEKVLELSRAAGRPWTVVDVGTGSGAIAVSLARYLPEGSRVYATDISREALDLARLNAARNGAAVEFVEGDLLTPFLPSSGGSPVVVFDAVVSNPPYIPEGELPGLPREVRAEPVAALNGGPDGLMVYRRLIPQAALVLRPGGYLVLEIGWDQAAPVRALLEQTGQYSHVAIYPDYGGRDRVVVAKRGEAD